MAERLGRFQRITTDEAHQRLTSARPTQALSEQLATLFATMEPLVYYELVLKSKEKGALIRERLMRFVEENALEGVHVRAGRKYDQKTVIIWRESGQQTRPESVVQDPPVGFPLGQRQGRRPSNRRSRDRRGSASLRPHQRPGSPSWLQIPPLRRHCRTSRTGSRSGGRAREPWMPWRRRR